MSHVGRTPSTALNRASSRGIGRVVLASLFAVALVIAPQAARPALGAADPLRTTADATYTLDPETGRVHVAIKVTEKDLKRNSATYIYYYTAFRFVLQPEATAISVSGGSAYRITTRKRDGYIEATVNISKALFYNQSTSFTIRYDLVGGKPRSDTPTRVGAAYASFGVWAWGDVGRGTVQVNIPHGFEPRFLGDTMAVTTSPTSGKILRATPADPSKFYTIITAENGEAFTKTRLSLAGGVEIVVESWPEDVPWRDAVTETLREAMPELRELIGLDWPVAKDLDVREKFAADLEGYAGFFLTDEQRIEISEDLDPVVTVHEAAHAWFNDDLFVERWIYEGLAEEYAWRTLVAVGGEAGDGPELPKLDDPGFADLELWRHPGAIRDQEADDRERYGYQAAFWVIHQITVEAGVDGMRDAFARADANLTAYPGAGTPETVAPGDGWRRLLDLTEPLDAPSSAAVDTALRDFVLGSGGEAALDDRRAARAAYQALLEHGSGWLPPLYVRGQMESWSFDQATTRMREATAVLELRDQIATAAEALGLTPDSALQFAYEGAKDNLDGAVAIANRQLEVLAAIATARASLDATPDLLTQIGLLGETPRVAYDDARVAFGAGELDQAMRHAATTTAMITGAAAVGQQRLIVAVGTTLGVVLLLLVLVFLLRGRTRRRRALALAAVAVAAATAEVDQHLADAPVTDPGPTEPYATLAADPATDQDEGGHARGDSPADP